MEDSVLAILTAAGLAGAAGHRAAIPALVLGLLHHVSGATAGGGEPFFALGPTFEWLADPVVMAILGIVAIAELVAENNADAPEVVNFAVKVPKAIAGFLVAAAVMGKVNDHAVLLAGSGLLGAGTALSVDKVRAEVKHAVNDSTGDATDGWTTKVFGWLESAWSALLAFLAIAWPLVALLGIAAVVGVWLVVRRAARARNVPCPHCREPRHPEATVCPHCRKALGGEGAPSALPA